MGFESPSTTNEENKHQKLIEYFKGLSPFDPKIIQHFEEIGDIQKTEGMEQQRKELGTIITSLEAGDKEPARSRLMYMVENNVGNFKIFDALTPQDRTRSLEGLKELVDQLLELDRNDF